MRKTGDDFHIMAARRPVIHLGCITTATSDVIEARHIFRSHYPHLMPIGYELAPALRHIEDPMENSDPTE